VRGDAREATGFDGALAAVARQPSGMALLGALAIGLLAYAAFSVVEARHQRVARHAHSLKGMAGSRTLDARRPGAPRGRAGPSTCRR
jgi:hypothetical protein